MTKQKRSQLDWEVLSHLSYSPDIAPLMSIYLSLFKILLMEKNFNPLEDCKRHLEECFVHSER